MFIFNHIIPIDLRSGTALLGKTVVRRDDDTPTTVQDKLRAKCTMYGTDNARCDTYYNGFSSKSYTTNRYVLHSWHAGREKKTFKSTRRSSRTETAAAE